MTTESWSRLLVVSSVLALTGCETRLEQLFENPDTNPMRKVLKVSMPLAYAANLTMTALDGADLPNVSFVAGDGTGVAPFLLEITVDDSFPLPEGIQATGVILVAGLVIKDHFSAEVDSILMTVVFTHLNLTKGEFTIQDIAAIPVVVDRDLLTGKRRLLAVYADMDINSGSSADPLLSLELTPEQIDARFVRYQNMRSFDGTVIVEQDTYILTVDDNRTPDDSIDDTYWVGGAKQYVEGKDSAAERLPSEELLQMVFLVSMNPACKRNPRQGGGFIQNLGVGNDVGIEMGHVVLGASSECDGTMEFLLGTGSYFPLTGRSFDLSLGN